MNHTALQMPRLLILVIQIKKNFPHFSLNIFGLGLLLVLAIEIYQLFGKWTFNSLGNPQPHLPKCKIIFYVSISTHGLITDTLPWTFILDVYMYRFVFELLVDLEAMMSLTHWIVVLRLLWCGYGMARISIVTIMTLEPHRIWVLEMPPMIWYDIIKW